MSLSSSEIIKKFYFFGHSKIFCLDNTMFILPDNTLNIKEEAYKSLFCKLMTKVQHVHYFQPGRSHRAAILCPNVLTYRNVG